MEHLIYKILSVVLIFIIGFVLKRLNVFEKSNAGVMLKIVFNVTLPALILKSVTSISIGSDFIILPISSALIIAIIFGISSLFLRKMPIKNDVKGVVYCATMIMNIGFVLPFIIAGYGDEGLARVTVFDLSNGFLTFTLVYYLANLYGNENKSRKLMLKKFMQSAPLWALLVAFGLNFGEVRIPVYVDDFLSSLGNTTIPLIMLALGVLFNTKVVFPRVLLMVIAIRMAVGLLIGFGIAYFAGLEGINRNIVIIGASAPTGYNTLVFSSIAGLNEEFAASVVSYSILIGIVLTSGLVLVL